MTTFERRQRLVRFLRERPGIKVTELAECLNVSQGTIRNDRRAIEQTGQIERGRGGPRHEQQHALTAMARQAREASRRDAAHEFHEPIVLLSRASIRRESLSFTGLLPSHGRPDGVLRLDQVVGVVRVVRDRELHAFDLTVEVVAHRAVVRRNRRARIWLSRL